MPLGVVLKLFEDFRGAGHRLLLAADVNPAVAGRDAHAQRLTNLPHMLIAGAEKGDQDFGTDNRNGGFTHPVRAGLLAVGARQGTNRNTTSILNFKPGRLAAVPRSVFGMPPLSLWESGRVGHSAGRKTHHNPRKTDGGSRCV